jgi:spermidine synthase
MSSAAVTVERVQTSRGELVLRHRAGHHELISNGVFLMDTRAGTSERLLVSAALAEAPPGARVLIGGLGVGFSLAEAAGSAQAGEIVVVEIEPAIVRWHHGVLAPYSGDALKDDPRVRIVTADLVAWLRVTNERFHAICLDIDNGPDWTVFSGNTSLYDEDGIALLRSRLAPDGVLTVWCAAESPAFVKRLEKAFGLVRTLRIEVPRGEPDVIYVASRSNDPRPQPMLGV